MDSTEENALLARVDRAPWVRVRNEAVRRYGGVPVEPMFVGNVARVPPPGAARYFANPGEKYGYVAMDYETDPRVAQKRLVMPERVSSALRGFDQRYNFDHLVIVEEVPFLRGSDIGRAEDSKWLLSLVDRQPDVALEAVGKLNRLSALGNATLAVVSRSATAVGAALLEAAASIPLAADPILLGFTAVKDPDGQTVGYSMYLLASWR